jgi:hypothetical protein
MFVMPTMESVLAGVQEREGVHRSLAFVYGLKLAHGSGLVSERAEIGEWF